MRLGKKNNGIRLKINCSHNFCVVFCNAYRPRDKRLRAHPFATASSVILKAWVSNNNLFVVKFSNSLKCFKIMVVSKSSRFWSCDSLSYVNSQYSILPSSLYEFVSAFNVSLCNEITVFNFDWKLTISIIFTPNSFPQPNCDSKALH